MLPSRRKERYFTLKEEGPPPRRKGRGKKRKKGSFTITFDQFEGIPLPRGERKDLPRQLSRGGNGEPSFIVRPPLGKELYLSERQKHLSAGRKKIREYSLRENPRNLFWKKRGGRLAEGGKYRDCAPDSPENARLAPRRGESIALDHQTRKKRGVNKKKIFFFFFFFPKGGSHHLARQATIDFERGKTGKGRKKNVSRVIYAREAPMVPWRGEKRKRWPLGLRTGRKGEGKTSGERRRLRYPNPAAFGKGEKKSGKGGSSSCARP